MDLISRATIDQTEAYRTQALARFAEAYDAFEAAKQAVSLAAPSGSIYFTSRTMDDFAGGYGDSVCRREKFLDEVRRNTDRAIWNHLIEAHGFSNMMDRRAHDEFRAQLEKDPPPATAEIAYATLGGLIADSDMLFRRGVAEGFARLDRRFRSHDGFKIGSRLVFPNAINSYGWNHYQHRDDDIRDVERAFYTLDGKQLPGKYAGIIGKINESLKHRPFVVENDYFRVRGFQNGNLHLWFLRDDLVRKINKVLAEYYGEVIGADADAAKVDPLSRPNLTPAKNLGFFETPEPVCASMIEHAQLWREQFTVLEPSAGCGRIAKAVRESSRRHKITCVELDHGRTNELIQQGFETVEGDFLTMTVERLGRFDRIIMNPPFDQQRDIDHVAHAVKFLKPGGRLVSVMSAGVEFRENNKAKAFRALVEYLNGKFHDLPAGSFAESGTMVNTCIVVMRAKE